ncbi:MAG: ribbon-helix-helix domain-containing protein [Caldisericaceae bacterium]
MAKTKYVKYTFYIRKQQLEKLKTIQKKTSVPLNAIVRVALDKFLAEDEIAKSPMKFTGEGGES